MATKAYTKTDVPYNYPMAWRRVLGATAADCVTADGHHVDAVNSFDATYGETRACPKGSQWNYGYTSAMLQNRSSGYARGSDFLEGPFTPLSVSLENPSRYKPFTYINAMPEQLTNGSLGDKTLPSDGYGFGMHTQLAKTPISEFVPGSVQLKDQVSTYMKNISYDERLRCTPGFTDCAVQGSPYSGPMGDGCVPPGYKCGTAMSVGRSWAR